MHLAVKTTWMFPLSDVLLLIQTRGEMFCKSDAKKVKQTIHIS